MSMQGRASILASDVVWGIDRFVPIADPFPTGTPDPE
jgi:hypothetical protein